MGNMCFSQVFCCVLFVPSVCTNELDKPNIIILTVDDLGWNAILSPLTIMAANSKNHQTPNIDKFISDGMAFTNAYTPLRNCASTHTALLIGEYAGHYEVYYATSLVSSGNKRRMEKLWGGIYN